MSEPRTTPTTGLDAPFPDRLTIRRVANGWVLEPGRGTSDEFVHVAKSADDLAEHVRLWAKAQVK